MAEEKVYTVPLRREWLKVPRWRRSKRAVTTLRNFLIRHTKAKDVKLGKWLNEAIWKSGGRSPPPRITVKITKDKDIARAELAELPPKAKRLRELKKVKAEAKKKREAAKKAKEEEKKKEEDYKKKKEEEKKKLEEAKAKAKMTKEQEMAMRKR